MRWRSGWAARVALWLAFLAVHAWLALLLWTAPLAPFADVTVVYRGWVAEGLQHGDWVGLQQPFVYPLLALLPMLLAAAFGTGVAAYGWSWIALVVLLDAAAVLVLTRSGAPAARGRGTIAAWWWLAFLLALGPVALGRLEAITAPLAIIAVRWLASRPFVAAALLTAAAWIKVWPAALLAAALLALRRRLALLLGALLTSLVVVGVGALLGGGRQLLAFLADQQGRGLQIESLLAAPWLISAAAGAPDSRVVWNAGIRTFEIVGPGTQLAAAASTPALIVLVLGVLALGLLAAVRRRGVESIAPLAIALVAALVVTNKVGSPQFTAWIAAPIVLALLVARRRAARRAAALPAVLALALALLTQLVYPFCYEAVLAAQPLAVLALEAKNALWLVLLGWGIRRLCRGLQLARRARPDEHPVLDRLHP